MILVISTHTLSPGSEFLSFNAPPHVLNQVSPWLVAPSQVKSNLLAFQYFKYLYWQLSTNNPIMPSMGCHCPSFGQEWEDLVANWPLGPSVEQPGEWTCTSSDSFSCSFNTGGAREPKYSESIPHRHFSWSAVFVETFKPWSLLETLNTSETSRCPPGENETGRTIITTPSFFRGRME